MKEACVFGIMDKTNTIEQNLLNEETYIWTEQESERQSGGRILLQEI